LIADLVIEAVCATRRRPETPAPSRAGSGSDRSTARKHLAAGLGKGGLLERAVLEDDNVPAEIAEQIFVALP